MPDLIVLKGDTYEKWISRNPILRKNEPVIEWNGNTPKLKYGDGIHNYIDLPYSSSDVDLSQYVMKDGDKTLTTNDFTDVLKNKLDGISSGADVSVNPDWNSLSGKSMILNKPEVISPSGVTEMIDSTLAPIRPKTNLIVSSGNGTTFLSNDGTYKNVVSNVNADWNSTSGSSMILNKPTIIPESGITEMINTSISPITSKTDKIITNGSGLLFLTNDGTYKSSDSTSSIIEEETLVGEYNVGQYLYYRVDASGVVGTPTRVGQLGFVALGNTQFNSTIENVVVTNGGTSGNVIFYLYNTKPANLYYRPGINLIEITKTS